MQLIPAKYIVFPEYTKEGFKEYGIFEICNYEVDNSTLYKVTLKPINDNKFETKIYYTVDVYRLMEDNDNIRYFDDPNDANTFADSLNSFNKKDNNNSGWNKFIKKLKNIF